MPRRPANLETEVLQEYVRHKIQTNFESPISFWKRSLSHRMSKYEFEQALLGRPSKVEYVEAIVLEMDKEYMRMWELIRDEIDPVELMRFYNERYR